MLNKKVYILVLFESALVFLFWFLPSFVQAHDRVIIIVFSIVLISIICNVLITRTYGGVALFILFEWFFLSLIFFQTLIHERWAQTAAIGAALLWGALACGLLSAKSEAGINRSSAQLGIAHMLSLASLFFVIYDIYALRTIFPLPSALIFIIFLLGVIVLHYATIISWVGFSRDSFHVVWMGGIMLTGFFAVLYFSSISVYAKALAFAIFYYTFLGMAQIRALPIVDRKLVKTYISIGLLSLALILVTARWR